MDACEQLLDHRLQRPGLHHTKIIPGAPQPTDTDRQPAEQLRRITLHHHAVPLLGRLLLRLTKDWTYTAVGGLARGASPVACAMLHSAAAAAGRTPPDVFIVTKASSGNTPHNIIGANLTHRRVLIVDDTCTTGRSAIAAAHASRAADATVVGIASVVDRASSAQHNITATGLPYRYLLTPAELGIPEGIDSTGSS